MNGAVIAYFAIMALQFIIYTTYTNIKLLNEAEVIEEIARISSGDITKNALEHAREMRLSK